MIFSSVSAEKNSCEKIYQKCFNNIPKYIIIYYKHMDTYGAVNTNNINFRDIPLIASKNSLIIKKIKKNEKIHIKKVFFLKSNTNISLKLANTNNFEIVNNYKFSKWYLVSYDGVEGFIFSDFVSLDKKQKKQYLRYRHINSVDWTVNKVDQQKNIELLFTPKKNNSFELRGFSWHYLYGYDEINYIFKKDISSQNKFTNEGIKLFFFDKNEIYLESEAEIFTGIYKKY